MSSTARTNTGNTVVNRRGVEDAAPYTLGKENGHFIMAVLFHFFLTIDGK